MSKRRKVLLFSSLIIALVGGLGLRVYFSSSTMKSRVVGELVRLAPQLGIKVGGVSLSLADGMLPHIALKISELEVSQSDSCLQNTLWTAGQVFLPLHWPSLFQGKLAMGKIRISDLFVSIGAVSKSAPCLSHDNQKSTGERESQQVVESPKTKTQKPFNGLIIDKFVIQGAFLDGYSIYLRGFEIKSPEQDGKFNLSGTFGLSSVGLGEEAWPTFNFFGDVNDKQFKVELLGRWREGVIEATLDYAYTQKDLFRLKSQVKHLPLANLMKSYQEYSGRSLGVFPSSMWLTCLIDYTGKISEYRQAPVVLEQCLVEGDAGQWESPKLVFDPYYGTWREPFTVKLTGLPLKGLVTFFNIDVLGGVLNEYGKLTGDLSVNPPDIMDFSGQVSDLEIYFSKKGVRAHQQVPKLKMQLEKKNGRISGLFTDFSFFQGRGELQTSFNFDKKFQEGTIQLQAKSVVFAPAVQELMVGNRVGPIDAFGKIKVSDGRFEVFKGDLGIEDIETQEFKAEKVKVGVSYVGSNVKAAISSPTIRVSTHSKKFEYLKPMLLEKVITDPWVEMRNFSVHFDGIKEKIYWTKGVVYIPQERVSISSEGTWQNKIGLDGWISVDFPAMKLLRWEINGDLGNPRILPSSQWLKELLTEKPRKKSN